MTPIKAHLLQLLIGTMLLASLIYLLREFFPGRYIHDKVWAVLLFYSLLTAVTGVVSIHFLGKDKLNSVSVILGSAVFRLLVSLVFVLIALWGGDENILWFVVNFFTIYLLYLLFDIYSLITNLRLHLK
nr:hypothetical protein [Cytophagales bacterium]